MHRTRYNKSVELAFMQLGEMLMRADIADCEKRFSHLIHRDFLAGNMSQESLPFSYVFQFANLVILQS